MSLPAALAIAPTAGLVARQPAALLQSAGRFGSQAGAARTLPANWETVLGSLGMRADATSHGPTGTIARQEAGWDENRATTDEVPEQETASPARINTASPGMLVPEPTLPQAIPQQLSSGARASGAGSLPRPGSAGFMALNASSLQQTVSAHRSGSPGNSKPATNSGSKASVAPPAEVPQPSQPIVAPQIVAPVVNPLPAKMQQKDVLRGSVPASSLLSTRGEVGVKNQLLVMATASGNSKSGVMNPVAPTTPAAGVEDSFPLANTQVELSRMASSPPPDALHSRKGEAAPGAEKNQPPTTSGQDVNAGIWFGGANQQTDAAVASVSSTELVNAAKSSSGGERRVAGASPAARVDAVLPAPQSAGASIDTAGSARSLASGHMPVNISPVGSGGAPESEGRTTAGLSAREPFSAIDAEPGHATNGWTHAGTHSAEAGFEDPTLGWVGVRADLAGGSVHAAVLPGSTAAAQALGSHMAGLHSYLQERRAAVATLTLAVPANRSGDAGVSQSMQQTGGQSAGQGNSPAPRSEWQPAGAAALHSAPADGASATALFSGRAGTYISVVA